MIIGEVNANREATISLLLGGPSEPQTEEELEAAIDTGFTDYLTLPPSVVQALGLQLRELTEFTLADGSNVLFSVYTITVSWDGQERTILALEAEGSPLIGMALLQGYRLIVDVVDGGRVTIEALA